VEEAVYHIQVNAIQRFGLKPAAARRKWWLFEKQKPVMD
jgi:hypothetical protein